MGRLNDLTAGNVGDILRRLRRLENASPLSSSSVGRGRMRFYDNSELLIENGALRVTGTATISGTFDMSGTANFTGTVSITGPLTVEGATDITGPLTIAGETDITGPLTVAGDTDITGTLAIEGNTTVSGKLDVTGPMATKGTLSVEGVTTLKNDLNVTSGGKINVGSNLTLDPSSQGGSVRFGTAGVNGSGGTGVSLSTNNGSGPYVNASPAGASVSAGPLSNVGLNVLPTGWSLTGPGRIESLPTTGNAPNLYADATGKLYRSTAA